MKSIAKALMVLLLLPAAVIGQVFKSPDFSYQTDLALLAKQIEKHSPLLKQFYAASGFAAKEINITPEEARALVRQKLKELNNEGLDKIYAKVEEDGEGTTNIGIALHILMNGLSNTDDSPGQDYKLAFGGGVGVYLMYTLAQFILMPELSFMIRPLLQEYGSDKFKERYSYLTLAFTAMYAIRMQTISLLLGLSPNFGYALGGKYKDGDDDWEKIEFDDFGIKRSNFSLGITAGLLLQNAMIIRLTYNLGLSKLYEDGDYKMYAIMLSLYYPFWKMK
jgi:hypothetical protein